MKKPLEGGSWRGTQTTQCAQISLSTHTAEYDKVFYMLKYARYSSIDSAVATAPI